MALKRMKKDKENKLKAKAIKQVKRTVRMWNLGYGSEVPKITQN